MSGFVAGESRSVLKCVRYNRDPLCITPWYDPPWINSVFSWFLNSILEFRPRRVGAYVAFSIARWVVSDVLSSVRVHLVICFSFRFTARARSRTATRDYTRPRYRLDRARIHHGILYCVLCLRHTIRDRLPAPRAPDHITRHTHVTIYAPCTCDPPAAPPLQPLPT